MRTISRDIVGGFVFSSDGKLLLGLMAGGGAYAGIWVVPGGGIDEGESKKQALKREFLEEAALDLSPHDIRFVDDIDADEREKTLKDTGERVQVRMRFNNFKVRIDKPAEEIRTKFNDEFDRMEWFSPSDLPKNNLAPGVSAALKRWGYIK